MILVIWLVTYHCAHCEHNPYGTEHLIILPLILHTVIIALMLLLTDISLCELYYYQASVFLIYGVKYKLHTYMFG